MEAFRRGPLYDPSALLVGPRGRLGRSTASTLGTTSPREGMKRCPFGADKGARYGLSQKAMFASAFETSGVAEPVPSTATPSPPLLYASSCAV